jgi:putative phage-type endonuclease
MNLPAEIQNPDRNTFLGGSDVAAIFGVSPYKTPVELWLQKTGQRTEEAPDKYKKRILERGKRLEPVILEMVVDKLIEQGHDVKVVATNRRYNDPQHPFLSCEIDFELILDGEHINGDCKSVGGFARKQWGEEETDEMPLHYAAQFMHGLGITGRNRCLVAALISLDDVAIYWIERDEETITAMRDKAVLFWNECVIGGQIPDVFTFADIKVLYPRDNGLTIEATDEIAEKVQQLDQIKHYIKTAEMEAETIQLEVAEYISPNMGLTYGGKVIVTFKAQEASRLDQKALAAQHPELYDKFKTVSTTRVFRIKKGQQ